MTLLDRLSKARTESEILADLDLSAPSHLEDRWFNSGQRRLLQDRLRRAEERGDRLAITNLRAELGKLR